MGCANSRLDDLPAVALCRERCKYLDEALRNGHAFADAHVTYLDSLTALAPTLHSFFAHHHHCRTSGGDETVKKSPPPVPAATPDQSNSSSDSSKSHLRFPSDSEDDDADKDDRSNHSLINEDETRRLIAHNFGFSSNGGGGLASSKPPPSPPPAALGSAWDFLNFFDTFEKYERLYVASSEREESEKVKSDGTEKTGKNNRAVASKDSNEKGETNISVKKPGGSETTTYEVSIVDKTTSKDASEKVSHNSTESSTTPSCGGGGTAVGVSEAMSEIRVLFVRASESGNEVLKLVYYRHTITSTSVNNQDPFRQCFDKDVGLSSRSLSSTLKKLSLWEKKLYCEVKAEEKLRIVYQRKLQELKYLDRENAKAHKAKSTRALLRDLTTKLKIAFQIVDRISIAINKVRDEELWPQIKELNHRLLPMWKTMLECHKSQYQRVAEVKVLDAITSSEKLYNADVKAAIQLKLELQTWNLSFFNWVLTLKDYVKSLNDWLTRCLLYEPEETPDGLMPFSPGRLGAPPVFVICNHWSQAIDRLSEKEVIGAIQGFVARIDVVLREHNVDMQQILIADKEIERKVRMLERQEQKVQKVKSINISVLKNHNEITRCSDLQQGLKQIFMAIEKFMANSIQVYEELRIRIEEVGVQHASDNPMSGA